MIELSGVSVMVGLFVGGFVGVLVGIYIQKDSYRSGVVYGAKAQEKIDLAIIEKAKADILRLLENAIDDGKFT